MDSGNLSAAFPSPAAAFETARDILSELVAIAAARLDAASGRPADAGADNWRGRRDEWLAELETLQPGDSDAVTAVLQSCGPLLARLRAEAP